MAGILTHPQKWRSFSVALTYIDQFKELLGDKKHILILFRKNAGGDAIATSMALLWYLQKKGKRADVVSEDFTLPQPMQFLKHSRTIRPQFDHLQKFIITIDVEKTGLDELSYDIKEEKLRIFITPKHGFLTRDHIRTAQSDFTYDLCIILDTPDLRSLGTLYENNTELFFKTPIINIDHNPANERFGHINMVDVTATSTAEIVFDLLSRWDVASIDDTTATALLTGIIAKTKAFKSDTVKPATLTAASALMELGAKQQYIMQNLFRTRTIQTLKLWGAALQHLERDASIGLVWTTITRDDLVRLGADEDALYDIVDELIVNSPEAKKILLLHEHKTARDGHTPIHVILHAADRAKGREAMDLLRPFHPKGDDTRAWCILDMDLRQAEETLLAHLRHELK